MIFRKLDKSDGYMKDIRSFTSLWHIRRKFWIFILYNSFKAIIFYISQWPIPFSIIKKSSYKRFFQCEEIIIFLNVVQIKSLFFFGKRKIVISSFSLMEPFYSCLASSISKSISTSTSLSTLIFIYPMKIEKRMRLCLVLRCVEGWSIATVFTTKENRACKHVSTPTLKLVREWGGYVQNKVIMNRTLGVTLSHPYIGV